VHELHVLEEEGDVVVVMKLTRGVSIKKLMSGVHSSMAARVRTRRESQAVWACWAVRKGRERVAACSANEGREGWVEPGQKRRIGELGLRRFRKKRRVWSGFK
jgi:hypothetical protein